MTDIITREELIYNATIFYYKNNKDHFLKLVDIVEKRSPISISLIEYFTLTYSKQYNTMYKKTDDNFFIVYPKYKNFLKGYGKQFIDLFRRKQSKKEKDFYVKLHETEIKTRTAQLHFFKWAFENEIIAYIENNLEKLEAKMFEYKNETKNEKNKKRKKSTSVSVFAIQEEVQF